MSLESVDAGAAAPANDAALSATVGAEGAATTTTPADAGAAPAADAAPAKPSMEDDLRKVWDKLNPARDNGKFAKRDGVADTATDPNAKPDGAAEAAAAKTDTTKLPDQPKDGKDAGTQATPASTDAPQSWSAEKKALWASVPPEAQTYIAQREAEAHQAITRAGEQIKAFEPIKTVVDQFQEVFQRNNLAPADGIARMLAVESWLGKNAKEAVAEIAKAYGVDLRELTGQPAAPGTTEGAQGTDAAAVPPIVSTLQTQLAETRAELGKVTSYLTAQQRAQLQGEQTALARQIADFAKDKPHFEAVRKHMAGLMSSGAAQNMQEAYDQATYALPETRNRILEDQRKQDDKKRTDEAAAKAAQAKKSAAVNVKSGTASGTRPKTMDETLSETASRLYSK